MEVEEFTHAGEKHRVVAVRWPSDEVPRGLDIIVEDQYSRGNVLHFSQRFDDGSMTLREALDKYIANRFPKDTP